MVIQSGWVSLQGLARACGRFCWRGRPAAAYALTAAPEHIYNAHMENTQRAHILIPGDLLREIDALVGPRGRSAFLLETARQEVQRRKLLHFLESEEPAWKAEGHPELQRGAAEWVRQLREQSERGEAGDRKGRRRSPRSRHPGSAQKSSITPRRLK